MKSLEKLLTALLLASALIGCGPRKPSVTPVVGVVTLDGQPVEGAAVMLIPSEESQTGGLPAYGTTDRHGRFALSTANVGPGAVPGEYRATVIKKETTGFLADKDGLSAGIAPGGIKVRWLVPERYADPNTSGLSVVVGPDMAPLNLDLRP